MATLLLAVAAAACSTPTAPMYARNDASTPLIVRLVVPVEKEGNEPRYLDYGVPPSSTRLIPAPEEPPIQAVLYDQGCVVLQVAYFTADSGFDVGGQLFLDADLTAGYTKDRLAGEFPAAEPDSLCANVLFDPSQY